MDLAKKQLLVVYIDTHASYFYLEATGGSAQLNFPPDVVSDADLVNREKFEHLVEGFVQTNFKGPEMSAVLVFSPNITFEKEIVPVIGKEIEEQTQEFTSIVPYEDVMSKTYKLNRKTKVVCVNKAFYDAFRTVFEKNKIFISMVLPMPVLTQVHPDLSQKLNLADIAQRSDSLRQFNMIETYQNEHQKEEKKRWEAQKINRRLAGLIGVFIVLLLALGVFAYMNLFQSQQSSKEEGFIKAFTPTPTPNVESQNQEIPFEQIDETGTSSGTQLLQSTQSAN